MLSLRTNIASLQAQRSMARTSMELDRTLAKLSSGYRITRAADDAAGLGVSTNLKAQIASYHQAARNAADGLSVAQTAEGALNETVNILTRLRELAMQSSSDGIGFRERGYIQEEANGLIAELDRIDATTEFNGRALFGGGSFQFQVGIRDTVNDFLSMDTTNMNVDANALSVDTVDFSLDAPTSRSFLDNIDRAIDQVSLHRARLGAFSNRLTSVISTLQSAEEAASAANSRIMDVDVALETSNLSRLQVLMQASISVLAQSNNMPQMMLKLLG